MSKQRVPWPRLVLVALLVLGAAVRLDFAQRAVVFRGDQNTVALMALHIERGDDYPLYFYGQQYMGALGAYAMAAVFGVTGPSDLAVSATMIAFSLLWIVALYVLFGRLIDPWAGVMAAAVMAFGPPALLRLSVEPWIGYVPVFALGTLIIYLGVRLNDADRSTKTEWFALIGMGALAALIIWMNPLGLPYLLVGFGLLVAFVIRFGLTRKRLIRFTAAMLAFWVCLTPVLVTGARYGLGALFGFRPSSSENIRPVLQMVFHRYIPDTFSVHEVMPPVFDVLLGICYVLILTGLFIGWPLALVRRHRRLTRAGFIPILFLLAYLPFFLTNPLAAQHNPRYFLMFFFLVSGAFAFPFAWRARWPRWTAVGCVVVLAITNVVGALATGRGKLGRQVAATRTILKSIVKKAEQADLRHVMLDTDNWHTLTWTARDRVRFVKPWNERHYPSLAAAIADDHAGFCAPPGTRAAFQQTFKAVGVTARTVQTVGKWTLFSSIELPTEQFTLVPIAWASLQAGPLAGDPLAGDPSAITPNASLLDRDEETIAGAPYDPTAHVHLVFPDATVVSGLRCVAPHEWDYPAAYTIRGTVNGTEWFTIQDVVCREANVCIYGNRLFCRGAEAVMECRFPPTTVRALCLDTLRAPAPHIDTCRFSEIYAYTTDGDGRPDADEARQIAQLLREADVDFAFGDPWLSAQLAAIDEAPDVLPYYSLRHPETHVSRLVPIRRGIAIIVEHGHAEHTQQLIEDAVLGETGFVVIPTDTYTILLVTHAPPGYESFPGLKWNSFTLVQTAAIARATWYSERGAALERSGHPKEALAYFQRSFETYEGIEENLKRLAPHNQHAAKVLKHITPDVKAPIRFPHGITLRGYTLEPRELVAGSEASLRLIWEIEGEIPYNYLPVFVHFLSPNDSGGETIRFQADHNLTLPLLPKSAVPRCRVLDEHTFIVPADCPAETLTIRFGALVWGSTIERFKPRTTLKTHHRAVEIGTVTISR